MPRSFVDKIAQGTRRVLPQIHKFVNSTPAANSFQSLFQSGTNPTAGSYAGAALARVQVTGGSTPSMTGGIANVTDPTAPNKNYLTRWGVRNLVANGTGRLYLLDLLAYYPGIDANSAIAQNMTSSAAGTDQRPRTANKQTVMFPEVTVALGAGAANLTVTYTRTGDLASARTTGAQAMVASSIVGRVPQSTLFLPLQAGDDGVASIQTAQLSAGMGAGGTFALVLADLIATLDIETSGAGKVDIFSDDAAALVEIPTGAALFWIWEPVSATASQRLQQQLYFSECDLAAA